MKVSAVLTSICLVMALIGNIKAEAIQNSEVASFSVFVAINHQANGMHIFVSTPDRQVLTLEVDPSDTIWMIKAKILDQTGMSPDQQKLVFVGKVLFEDENSLAEYKIK